MEDNLADDNIIMEHSYSVLSGSTCPNGKTAKGWEHFDQIISRFLVEQKIPGASVAVSKKGILLYQQGYGVAGAGCRVRQDSMFRIASISKPVTAAIVVQLFDKLKIPLNTKVFGKAGILKSYRTRDKRMKNITVRHLLQHSAGWDRDKVGDAVFVRPQCVVKEHPDSPAYSSALLAYALRRKLQFSPGTWHSYSNLGYLVLGEIIETLSGQPYHRFLRAFLQDLDIHGVVVGKRGRAHYKCREVEYFNNREPQVVDSIYPAEGMVLPQYGGMAMESSASYGGLVADAVSLLRFIDCMEEAVAQSNTDECRKQPNSMIGDLLNIKADAEQPESEVVWRHDRHCQPEQQLIMYVGCTSNPSDSDGVNLDSHFDHTNKADLLGVTFSKSPSSEAIFHNRNSAYVNEADSSFVLSDNLKEEPVYRQNLSPGHDTCDLEHSLINASDVRVNKYNTECMDSKCQCDDIFVESGSTVTSQIMQYRHQCDKYVHQNFGFGDGQCNSSYGICQPSQQIDSSNWHCNSSSICQPSQNFDSSVRQYNTSAIICQPGQNVNSSDRHYISGDVCKSGQNLYSSDRQCNCSVAVCQSSQTSETYVENNCGNCSFKMAARKCSICELCESNCSGHVNNLKPIHLIDHTSSRLAQPLMTNNQVTDSLSRPDYENGRDWYGLGWDVQDNGKSWGHTGGMDGSCGTLFHHQSGLNWAFLLNSWAGDADLNGVIKCALCSVSDAKMYDHDILSIDSELGVRIVTKDKSQIIFLCISESILSKVISHAKTDGFFITWISTVSQDFSYVATKLLQSKNINKPCQQNYTKPGKSEPDNKYIAVFNKSHITDYFVMFNKTATELQNIINESKKDNYVICFFDSFVDSEAQLRYTAVFKYNTSIHHEDDIIVLLAMAASDYVKQVKSFLQSYYIVVQSVTEVCAQLYVSVILYARNIRSKLPWLPHIVERNIVGCVNKLVKKTDNCVNKTVKASNRCANKPVKTTNNCANKPVKATNVPLIRNAELTEDYSNMTTHSSTVSKTQHSRMDRDSSFAQTVLQKPGDAVFQESGREAVFQESGREAVFQKSGRETIEQESGGETVFQESGGETVFQESEETVFQESGGETVFQESGEIVFQESGETVFQESGGETVFQESGGETVFQESGETAKNCSSETILAGTSNKLSARSKCQSKTSKKSKGQTSSSNSAYWVQITPESFLTELNRQAQRNKSLVYAKFYNAERKPYVSGCWYPQAGSSGCYQRLSMSKYGLVPELVEAAAENVHLQCLSEYEEEDGVVYYAAIWQVS